MTVIYLIAISPIVFNRNLMAKSYSRATFMNVWSFTIRDNSFEVWPYIKTFLAIKNIIFWFFILWHALYYFAMVNVYNWALPITSFKLYFIFIPYSCLVSFTMIAFKIFLKSECRRHPRETKTLQLGFEWKKQSDRKL